MINKPHINQVGAAYVETAISFLVFMTIVIMIVDLMTFTLRTARLELVVNRAIRDATVIGNYNVTTIKNIINDHANQHNINLDKPGTDIRICDQLGVCPSGGMPGELIFIQVRIPFNFFWKLLPMPITSSALGRNEPSPQ